MTDTAPLSAQYVNENHVLSDSSRCSRFTNHERITAWTWITSSQFSVWVAAVPHRHARGWAQLNRERNESALEVISFTSFTQKIRLFERHVRDRHNTIFWAQLAPCWCWWCSSLKALTQKHMKFDFYFHKLKLYWLKKNLVNSQTSYVCIFLSCPFCLLPDKFRRRPPEGQRRTIRRSTMTQHSFCRFTRLCLLVRMCSVGLCRLIKATSRLLNNILLI